MGRWAGMQIISKELREDLAVPVNELAGMIMRTAAERQGYHPVGNPVLTWWEITQQEVDLEVSINGGAWFAAGDWRVHGVIEVSEGAEIPQVR